MTTRPAATLVLVREHEGHVETFLLRRAVTMAFAPRMHVFPGGRVDNVDFDQHVVLQGATPHAIAERASAPIADALALYACAIRETLEESGVDLAIRDSTGALVVDVARIPIIDHWVTPETESHRYDVRFFAARLPDGQGAELVTTEATEGVWMRPAAAIDEFLAGRLPMLPPTEAVLRYLSEFGSVADFLHHAAHRHVQPLLPRRVTDPDGTARWMLVNDRTREVIKDVILEPHTRETDGVQVREP